MQIQKSYGVFLSMLPATPIHQTRHMQKSDNPFKKYLLFFLAGACMGGGSPAINFNYEDTPLTQAVAALIKNHGAPILFQKRKFGKVHVDARCSDCDLETALNALLADTDFSWIRTGRQYVITKRAPSYGAIRGLVQLESDQRPLGGVVVWLFREKDGRAVSTPIRTRTREDGNFSFPELESGSYTIQVQNGGFAGYSQGGIRVEKNKIWDLTLAIEEVTVAINEMVVGPSSYNLLADGPVPFQFLDKQQIAEISHLGDDVYRTMAVLPGADSDDISATFRIRGGLEREVLVTLDGMELYNPFHLQNLDLFSIVDSEAIGGLNVVTGGFTADHGNRLSGIFAMETQAPRERRSEVGFSFNNVRVKTEGPFAGGLGQYMFSARRGFLRLLLEVASVDYDSGFKPNYNDSQGRLQYALNERHTLAVNYLLGSDRLRDTDEDEQEDVTINTDSTYYWTNLKSWWTDALYSETGFFMADTRYENFGHDYEPFYALELKNKRNYRYGGLKQNWSYTASERHLIKWGWEYRDQDADYDYKGQRMTVFPGIGSGFVSREYVLDKQGHSWGLYVSDRFRPTPELAVELGLRSDYQTWQEDSQWSPRLNLSYRPRAALAWHLAAGRFYQPHGLHEIHVEDDDPRLYAPATSDHFLAGLEARFSNGLRLRLEAYDKKMKGLPPRFENILGNINFVGAELNEDRVRIDAPEARAQGVELLLQRDVNERLSLLFHYTLSSVKDRIDGRQVSRPWDQRHTAFWGFNYRRPDHWNFSLNYTFQSGWRTTQLELRVRQRDDIEYYGVDSGPLFGEKFPEFHRVDLRYNYYRFLREGKGFSFYLDISNALDHPNVRGYEDIGIDWNGPSVKTLRDEGLPLLPTFGISYRF